MFLVYHDGAGPDELAVGTCVIRPAQDSDGSHCWLLWFLVQRESDRVEELMAVRVNPGGPPVPGPDDFHHVWGLMHVGEGSWQVAPSINVMEDDPTEPRTLPGVHPVRRSIWHETPTLIGVPESPPPSWATEAHAPPASASPPPT